MRILGLSGSLRQGSHNASLLRAAATLLPPGVELEAYERRREVPPRSLPEPGARDRLGNLVHALAARAREASPRAA